MFAIFNLGGGEIILILALVLILFGAKKLPELAKGLGTGIKEFKKATREVTDEIQNSSSDNSYSNPPPRRQVENTVQQLPGAPVEPPKSAPLPPATVAQPTEQKS